MFKYAKTIVVVVIAVAYAVQAAISDDVVTTSEWIGIALSGLTALGVWAVPNKTEDVPIPPTSYRSSL